MIEQQQKIALALEAGKRYLSPQTGLIHYCYEEQHSTDTIPLFENLSYCLTLFRTLIKDQIEEGKRRLKYLLSFRKEDGFFPIYLHQYPTSIRSYHAMYPLFLIDKYFHKIIGKSLRLEIRNNLTLPAFSEKITNSQEAGIMALHLTCEGCSLHPLFPFWDFEKDIYCGPLGDEYQRKEEIDTTLFDLFMGDSPRILRPHPIHLHASLVIPIENSKKRVTVRSGLPKSWGKGYHIYRKTWKEQGHIHTLVCQDHHLVEEDGVFTYPVAIPDEQQWMELNMYTDRFEGKKILINGERATVFKLEDNVSIITPVKTVHLIFHLVAGQGDFMGHVSFGNRPSQLDNHRNRSLRKEKDKRKEGGIEKRTRATLLDYCVAYDWRIGIRTVRRTSHVQLAVDIIDR